MIAKTVVKAIIINRIKPWRAITEERLLARYREGETKDARQALPIP
ncbi:hypothetical protein [Thermacetogenium phaeum]|nr:hypothetical protein [Thermacetogenium phaeum]